MNTIIAKVKSVVESFGQSVKGFYVGHRLITLSGITILSILLIVWARMGFTLQFGQSQAGIGFTITADKTIVDRNESFAVHWSNSAINVCVLNVNPTIAEVVIPPSVPSTFTIVIPGINATTTFKLTCAGQGSESVTVKLKSDVYTCLQNLNQECTNSCAQPINNGGNCPGAQFCCAKAPPITVALSAVPTAAPQGGKVRLSWTSTGATTCTNAYGVFTVPAGVAGTNTSADGSLPYTGTTTHFIVSCSDDAGHTTLSNQVDIALSSPVPTTTANPPPPTRTPTPVPTTTAAACSATAPTGLAASAITATSATLSWTPGAGGSVQAIRVGTNEQDVKSGCPSGTCVAAKADLPATQSSYQLTGLVANTTYYSRVVTYANTTCYKDVIISFTSSAATTPTPTLTVTPTPTLILTPTPTLMPTPASTLTCAPINQTVNIGQAAALMANGGNGQDYYWQADGQTRTGPQVSFAFATAGIKQVIVTSTAINGNVPQAICTVNVITPAPTGGIGTVKTGPGDAVVMALLVSGIVTLLYVSYTHTSMFRRREIDSITRKKDPLDFRG